MEDEIVDIDGVDGPVIPPFPLTNFNNYDAAAPQEPPQDQSLNPQQHPSATRRSTRTRHPTLKRISPIPEAGPTRRSQTNPSRNPNKKKGEKWSNGPPGTRVKLKLGDKANSVQQKPSFLGPWDREIDSDDDELAFEEQFILRMPEGEDLERLRKMVAARDISNDVWFKFKDPRRAVFHIGTTTYTAKLVDLPTITESQKTLDNRQMFKIADISQMLVVETPITSNDPSTDPHAPAPAPPDPKDFVWPHGLTPPLRHVRKRRFRKRVNRATIETVEQEVERLLREDDEAEETQYTVLENVNPDLSDSEYDNEHLLAMSEHGTPVPEGRETPFEDYAGEAEGDEGEAEDDDGFDAAFAAELDQVDAGTVGAEGPMMLNTTPGAGPSAARHPRPEGADEDEEDDEDEDLFGGEIGGEEEDDESEDEDEDDEDIQARKLLAEEIRDLQAAVDKKVADIASVPNPMLKKRFESALVKLRADLESRMAQLQALEDRKLAARQARAQIEEDSINVGVGGDAGGRAGGPGANAGEEGRGAGAEGDEEGDGEEEEDEDPGEDEEGEEGQVREQEGGGASGSGPDPSSTGGSGGTTSTPTPAAPAPSAAAPPPPAVQPLPARPTFPQQHRMLPSSTTAYGSLPASAPRFMPPPSNGYPYR